jgi:hypothetical protein
MKLPNHIIAVEKFHYSEKISQPAPPLSPTGFLAPLVLKGLEGM